MFKKIIKIIPFFLFVAALIIGIYNLLQEESSVDLVVVIFVLNVVGYIIYIFAYNEDWKWKERTRNAKESIK